MRPLSSLDIKRYYKKRNNKYFSNCIPKDLLQYESMKYKYVKPEHLKKFWIVNLDNSLGEGTHWVLCSLLDPEYAVYFDSYGVQPPLEIIAFLKKYRKNIKCNVEDIQPINSSNCGYYTLYVADELSKGISYENVLDDFTKQVRYNDDLLEQLFAKF